MEDIFQPTDKLKSLYQGLSQNDGLKTPYEQFEKDMMDTAKLRQIHTFLSNKPGFEVPWDDFQSQLFSHNGKEDKEEVKIPQERFQQPPQMPQDTFNPSVQDTFRPTMPEPEARTFLPSEYPKAPDDFNVRKYSPEELKEIKKTESEQLAQELKEQINTQTKILDENIAQILKDNDVDIKKVKPTFSLSGGVGAFEAISGDLEAKYFKNKEDKEKYKALISAKNIQDETYKMLTAPRKGEGGFWRGTGESLSDLNTYLFGVQTMSDYINVKPVLRKVENDEELSQTDEIVLKTLLDSSLAAMSRADDLSNWYVGGKIFAESLPFMLQIAATGGVGAGIAKGSTRLIERGLGKYLRKTVEKNLLKAGKEITDVAIRKGVENILSNKVLQTGLRMTTGAAGQTVLMPSTWSNVYSEMQKDVEGYEDGKFTLSDGKNLYQALGQQYVEVSSEMSGPLFGVAFSKLGKGLSKIPVLKKIPVSRIGKLLGSGNKQLERFGFHGLTEEIGEEIFGEIQSLAMGLSSFDEFKEFWSKDNFSAMLIGFAPMTILGGGQNLYYSRKTKSGLNNAINSFQKYGEKRFRDKNIVNNIISELNEITPENAFNTIFEIVKDNGGIDANGNLNETGVALNLNIFNYLNKKVQFDVVRNSISAEEAEALFDSLEPSNTEESAPESPQPPSQPIPRQPSPREQYETQVRNETAPFVNENGNIVVYKDAITESGEPVFLIKGDPESGEGFFIRTASGEEQFSTDKSRLTGERTELTVDQFILNKLTEWDGAQQLQQEVENRIIEHNGQTFILIGEQDNEMMLQPIDEQQNPIGDVKFVSKEQLAQEAGEEAARQEIAATEQAKEQGRLITINETDYPVETQEDGSFIVSLPENGDPAVFESDIRSTLPGEQQNRIELLTEDVIVPPAVPWGQGTTQKVTVGIRILPEGQEVAPQEAISPAGETVAPKVEATPPGEATTPELPLNQPTYTQNEKETTRENILSLVDESINELDASKLDGIRVDNDPELSKALTDAVNSINETNETAQNLLNSFDKAKTSNEYAKLADQFRALPDNVQAKFNKEFKSKDAVLKKLVKKEGEREWIRQQEEREYVPFEESSDSFNQWASLHATNPHDIHEAYQNELANAPYNLLQGWQLDLLGEKFTSESFKRYADPNWLSQGLARAWLGGEKRRTIDQFTAAWEMESGEVIDPQQVVDFMMQYPTKNVRKTTDLSQELARRYRYITGESIKNYSSARELPPAEKLFDKFITDNKLENDYFTSEDALKLLETHRDKLSTEEYETIKKHLENEITESEQAASFWGEEEPVSPLGETTERERHGVQDEAEAEERLLQSPGLGRDVKEKEQSLTDVFGQVEKQETSYLKRAIGENANLKEKVKRNLERAKRMHNQGFDPLIIKYETGWEQGVDKMWRYEVADDYKRFDKAFEKLEKMSFFADTDMTFHELIGDDPLFNDYPRLKDMKFTKKSSFLDVFNTTQGWYNEETNTLNITPYAQNKRATLIHEVQHAIQAIENWARGGNEQEAALSLPTERIKEVAEKIKTELQEKRDVLDKEINEADNLRKYLRENPEKRDLLQKYVLEYQELSDRESKRYKEVKKQDENINPFISDNVTKEISNKKSEASSKAISIIKEGIENRLIGYRVIHGAKKHKTVEAGVSSIIADNIREKSKINNKIRAIDQAKTKQEIFESVKDNAGSAFYNAYRALAGEEEARAMSKRDNLTPRERRESLISSSFDVASEEQIVIFGKQGESKSALPTETITLTNGIKLTPDTYRGNSIVRIDNVGGNLTKLVRAEAVQSPEGTLFIPAGKFNESLRKMQELMNVSIQETPTEAPKSTDDAIQGIMQKISEKIPGLSNIRIVSGDAPDVRFRGVFLDINQKTKLYKKRFGERTARLIRNKMPVAFDQHEQLISFLQKKIPIKNHMPYIIENMAVEIEKDFLNQGEKETDAPTKDLRAILKEVGYDVTKIVHPDQADQFVSFYEGEGSDGRIGGSIICTYNNVRGRIASNYVLFIVRDDAAETLRAESLTQDNLSESWKKHLEKNGRKNEDGTYNLAGLKNHREDPFSTSVLSIQVSKDTGYLKVISRYNHSIHEGNTNPDAVFNKDLSKLAYGLEESLYKELGVSKKSSEGQRLPDMVVQDHEGNLFVYGNEEDGAYYGDGFYIKINGEAVLLDPNTERMIHGNVLNQNGRFFSVVRDMSLLNNGDVTNVKFIGKDKISYTDRYFGEVELTTENGLIKQGVKMNEDSREGYLQRYFGGKYTDDGKIKLGLYLGGGNRSYAKDLHIFWSDKIEQVKFIGYNFPSSLTLETLGNVKTWEGSFTPNKHLKSLGELTEIMGDADFGVSGLTSLGKLRVIDGELRVRDPKIKSLGELEIITGNADLNYSEIESLGRLRKIDGSARFQQTRLTSLDNLEEAGDINISNSNISSLGKLRIVKGNAILQSNSLKSLGRLKIIYGRLDIFGNSKTESLGELEFVGREANMAYVPLKSLGKLKAVGGSLYTNTRELTDTGELLYIGGSANLGNAGITSLKNIKIIGRILHMNDLVSSAGSLEYIGDLLVYDHENSNYLSPKDYPNEIKKNFFNIRITHDSHLSERSALLKINELRNEITKKVEQELKESYSDMRFRTVDTETAKIKENAIKNGTFMKAPNGKATNLNENQWLQVRTENFKDWFGDWENDAENASKVVDENGEPLVVYHGTNKKFNAFRLKKIDYTKYKEYEPGDEKLNYIEGVYFSKNKNTALRYFDPYDKNSTLYSVFLNIKSPKYEKTNIIGTSNVEELIKDGYDGIIATGGDIFYSPMNEIIATSPNQIKSATDNIGEFSPESNDIRFRTTGLKTIKINGKDVRVRPLPEGTQVVDGFYSPLEKSVRELKSNKWGTGQQALNELKKAGLKADEIQWTGIEEWLREQKNVSKEQILDYLKENRVELVEVVKEKPDADKQQHGIENFKDNLDAGSDDYDGLILEYVDDIDDYTSDIRDEIIEDFKDRRLPSYWQDKIEEENDWAYSYFEGTDDTKYSDYQLPGEKENYREVLITLPQRGTKHIDDAKSVSIELMGKKWKDLTERERKELWGKINNINAENKAKREKENYTSSHFDKPNIIGHLRMSDRVDADGNKVLHIDEVQSDWAQEGREKGFEETPTAPYITNTSAWTKLMAKYAIREAVKSGLDKVTWTSGETQNDRYDLSKQVNSIYASEYSDRWDNKTRKYDKVKEVEINVKGENDPIRLIVDDKGNVIDGDDKFTEHNLTDIVGKEVAEKILSQEQEHEFDTDDLKVGGSGMKGFYGSPTESKTGIIGKAFQQAVRDITGERNVRIGETEIDTGDGETVIQHSIEITPEIITNTQQGMPLFKNSFSGTEKGTVSDKVISNEIKSVFDILNANAVNAGAIHVVQTPEQLPPKFAKDAVRLKNTQGFYLPTTGETYFITDNISSPKEALKTWVHEVTGHKGLRNLIPEHLLIPLLEKFYDDLGGAEVIDSSLPSSYRNASKAEKMEEYIVFLAEDIINKRDLTPQKKSSWKKILDGIMNLLNKLFDKKVKFTHADVEELIRASVQSVYQKEKESERFKDRATQETMPKYFDEVLESIKRGELRERKSGDMLKSEKNAQKYFEVNPDRLRHTLSVFNRPEFRAYRDKNIRPNELQGLLNLSGVKAIEKELIRDVVRSNYPKTKLIPYNELEAVVRANIIPLERIESTSYADYGADAIQGDFDNAYTLIFNFPEVEHGKEGHFSYQFTPDKTRKIDYVPKQLDENTWVAVEDGYMEQGADESNIMRFVGTAANSREKVEKWINDYEERFAEGIKDVNRGMYGHIRIWERGNDVIMAEVQSDFFQKFGARKTLIENKIKNSPELTKEKEDIEKRYSERIKEHIEEVTFVELKELGESAKQTFIDVFKDRHPEEFNKTEKQYAKELTRFENKVYSMLSPAEKQFIASAKVWEKRLLHEAIAEAMDKGADRFLIPTPHTLATIEGYIEGAAPPYEVISDRNAYSNGNLGDGDIIEMGGEEYVVIESDPYDEHMRIAPAKDMDRWKIREALQEDVNFKYDDLAYEYSGKLSIDDINEIGDNFYVSEVKEILLEGLNSKAEEKGESIEDVFIELDDFQEEIEEAIRSEESKKYRFNENVKEYFEDEIGYNKAIKVGDEIFIWKSEPHYEIISQPGQNRVSIDDFNIEDLAESEQRVLKKYEEYGEQLKEEFGDNVSNEVDENGYGWVAVDLSGVETGRPVVAYRTKHENPHLWKNWTREGDKYVSAQGKEWNVPDTGTLKHEVYQKLMENIDNHRTKAFEPEVFDYWFNKHRKNLKGNLGAVRNTTTVAAQMYDMMPQRYSYKPEPNLKTRLSFPENGWLEVDRDVFMHRDGQVWEAPVEGTIANDIYKQVIDNITKSERNFDPAIFNVLMNAFENSISQYELFRGRSIYYNLAKKIADTISDAMPKDETIRYRTKGNSAKNVAQEATKPEKPMFLDQMAQAEHDAKVAEEMYTKAKREKPNWHEEQRRMREFWIDQNLPIEGWEADILNNGGKMNEYSKPYRDMRNSFGRIEYLYNKFHKEFMLPFPKILADVVKQGISQELAVSYMIARSGLKRNEVMRSEELESWADRRLELLKKKHPDKKITLDDVKNSKEYKAKHKELSNTDFASLTGFREEGDPRHPDEIARSIVFWVESKLTPETTERIWEHWNKTAQGIRDIWLEGGEITKEQYNFLNKRMPDYVPMRGWRHGKSEEIIYHKEGGKGKSYMKAKGRVSLPDNPIAVIQTMGFKAISEQVSNEVNTAALNLMVNNYGGKFKDMHRFKKAYFVQEIIRDADGNPEKVWTLYREPITRPDGSTDYEIATPPESMFDSGEARQFISREHEQLRTVYNAKEHEVVVKKAGVPYVMIFDEKYTTVAQALNHNNTMFRFLGREWDARKIGDNPLFDGVAAITNFMKGMMTTRNPVFTITNFPRDQQNIAITQYIKNNARIGKANKYTTPEAVSSLWRYLSEEEFVPMNEADRITVAFFENGGAVGWARDRSVKQIEKELKRQLKYAFRKGTIKQSSIDAAMYFFDKIERINTLFEDVTRRSVFEYGVKDLGLSYKDAAFESRMSSDDFNMRGKGTKMMESNYAFFKAAINELDKNVRLAKYNTGRAFASAAMMVLWGYIEALFNDTADGDKDDYFSINPYVRQNYMVIKTGKKYFRMPISQFWRGFHAMGVNIYDAAWGHITPGQAAGRTIASLIAGMSPVDLTELFSDGKLTLGALVPTSIKPIYEVKVNRDFMDNPIYHEKFTLKMQEEARNSNLHKKNVNVAAKFMTDMLWKLGGGDDGDNRIIVDKDGELKYVPRVFDVNPAWIEHLFRGYTGGVGRFLNDLTKFVYELVAPNEAISINNIPFLNSFLRNTPDDKWKYIREWQDVMKYAQMWKAEDTEAYRGAKSEDSTDEDFDYAYSLKNMKNNEIYQTFMAYNRNIERIVKAKGLQDEDAAHEITDLMKEGIERINEIKKQHKK